MIKHRKQNITNLSYSMPWGRKVHQPSIPITTPGERLLSHMLVPNKPHPLV